MIGLLSIGSAGVGQGLGVPLGNTRMAELPKSPSFIGVK